MRPYFEKMTPFGKALTDKQKEAAQENIAQIKEVEKDVAKAVDAVKNAGISADIIHKRGQMTVWDRIEYLLIQEHGVRCTPFMIPSLTKKAQRE